MRVLNLYAGLGGNRLLWDDVEVVAVEWIEDIAEEYAANFPGDTVFVCDAHDYLLEHFAEFDFIWSSPPCQSHSRSAVKGRNQSPRYPDMKLYQEIILLQTHFKGGYVVENVIPYYEPLITPQVIQRHSFWSNFHITAPRDPGPNLFEMTREQLEKELGVRCRKNIYYDGNHDPLQVLRNCVRPELGKAVLDSFTRPTETHSEQSELLL